MGSRSSSSSSSSSSRYGYVDHVYLLPEELVTEILARLPAKSVMRFRCVSKLWYALTTNPTFITKHLLLSNSNSNSNTSSSSIIIFKHLHRKKPKLSLLSNKTLHLSDDVYIPFFNDDDSVADISIYGPCDGIVCLYSPCLLRDVPPPDYLHGNKIALWNPTTREFKPLPLSPAPRPPGKSFMQAEFGIGFNSKTNDYNVVRISLYANLLTQVHETVPLVDVYALSTNSWRKVDTIVPLNDVCSHSGCSTYLKDFYYWWAYAPARSGSIIAFDMCNEVFRKISTPRPCNDAPGSSVALQELNGSLALCVWLFSTKCFTMWLMKDDGTPGNVTWIKQYTVQLNWVFNSLLGFCKNGDLLLGCNDRQRCGLELVTYNPSTQEFGHYPVPGSGESCLQVAICKESLVSLSTKNAINEIGHED